jgi:hypothetical protein
MRAAEKLSDEQRTQLVARLAEISLGLFIRARSET